MFSTIAKWSSLNCHWINFAGIRTLTTGEVSTALRPFYFSVHPDLFGQYPTQRSTNENSLKQLSSLLEKLQKNHLTNPCTLQFYIRNKKRQDELKLINIYLKEKDVRDTILTILKSCDLPTEYIDKIPKPKAPDPQTTSIFKGKSPAFDGNIDFSSMEDDPIFSAIFIRRTVDVARDKVTLKKWLAENHGNARGIAELYRPIRDEVSKLEKTLWEQLGLTELRWDCGWNETHYKACLRSLNSLVDLYPDKMKILRGRVVVFAPFTGVSLDGHIMLNNADVRHSWLELIKNVKKYDALLLRLPAFEKAVSQVLRDIKVVRRKFMPKILAGEYEKNLMQLTTSLSDYRGRRDFPAAWPQSLSDYQLVVETEAGPLMVSPTGQFIVPSSCPGTLLVKFISDNMAQAQDRIAKYKSNKYVERSLKKQCQEELNLIALRKDDSVSPDLMIKCCEKLLKHKSQLSNIRGLHLTITTYYSVLSDGVVCIPWNWNL